MPSYHSGAVTAYLETAQRVAELDEPSFESLDELLVESEELERTLALGMLSGDADVRELAAAQLTTAAALDFAVANDLLWLEQGERSSYLRDVLADEQERVLLLREPAFGMRALFAGGNAPAGGAPVALDDLDGAAGAAVGRIVRQSAEIAGECCSGLVSFAAGDLLGAVAHVAGQAADKLLGSVYDQLRRYARIAIKFVTKGVSKLIRLLGPAEDSVRAWLAEEVRQRLFDAPVQRAVHRALGVDAVLAEVDGLVAAARLDGTAVPERVTAGVGELESLSRRFGKQHRRIMKILWLLDTFGGALRLLAAWAWAAVAGVYVLVLGCGLWLAGDYLDWLRTNVGGRLDLVAGVRSTVTQALAAGP